MADWSPDQYLKFEDERARPPIDLLRRVPLAHAQRCVDVGCGPGNSTELVANRYPDAQVIGLDSSPSMLAKARERLPAIAFEMADISTWHPTNRFDLIFANAVLQWVPDHATLFPRLVTLLNPGGCLAVQMPNNLGEPSHVLMRELAEDPRLAEKLSSAVAAKERIGSFDDYYRSLSEAGCAVDLWQTIYVHPLTGAEAIVEWFKSTGLKPFLDPLSPEERSAFLAEYQMRITQAYPEQPDGKVLLRFPRLFFVAQKRG